MIPLFPLRIQDGCALLAHHFYLRCVAGLHELHTIVVVVVVVIVVLVGGQFFNVHPFCVFILCNV